MKGIGRQKMNTASRQNQVILSRRILSGMLFFVALFNLLSTVHVLRLSYSKYFDMIPQEYLFKSHYLEVMISVILLITAYHLSRGKKSAWFFSIVALSTSLILHVLHRNNFLEFAIPVAMIIILMIRREDYKVRGRRGQNFSLREFWHVLFIMCFITVISIAAFYVQSSHFIPSLGLSGSIKSSLESTILLDTTETYKPTTHLASLLIEYITVAYITVYSYLAYSIFTRIWSTKDIGNRYSKKQIANIIKKHGVESLQCFALRHDKEIFLSSKGTSFLSYKIVNGVGLTLGGPIGPSKEDENTIKEFSEFCRENDVIPAFYNFSEKKIPKYKNFGMMTIKIGEEGIIRPNTFSLNGAHMKNLRNSVTKSNPEIVLQIIENKNAITPQLASQLETTSREWELSGRRNLGFSCTPFNTYDLLKEKNDLLVIGQYKKKICAFLTVKTYPNNTGVVLDILRRQKDAPNGIIEQLLVKTISYVSANRPEINEFSLGLAGLADSLMQVKSNDNLIEKIVFAVGHKLDSFYEYKSLFRFKNKFNPKWEPRFMAIPNSLALTKVLYAIYTAHLNTSHTSIEKDSMLQYIVTTRS